MANIGSIKVRIGADIKNLEKNLKRAEFRLKRSGERMARLGDQLTSSLTLPLAAFGFAAIKSAGKLQSLEKGMVSMMGSAEEARKEIALLRKEALKPGLNIEQALKGSIRLQAVEVEAGLARKALAAFGNAIALVGGSASDLDGVTLALTQIASKGKISAEEINQLAERVPQIRIALKSAFGTADTEELQKLGVGFEEFIGKVVGELEKLPQASGGINNALENMRIQFEETAAAIGTKLFPVFSRIAAAALKVTNAFTSLTPAMQDNVIQFGLAVAAAGPLLKVFGSLKILAGTAVGAVVGALGKLKVAFIALTGPIGIAVAAISAIAFAIIADLGPARKILADVVNFFIHLYNNSLEFRGIVETIAAAFKTLWATAKAFFNISVTGFKTIGEVAGALLKGDFASIKDIVKAGFEQAKDDGTELITETGEAWQKALENTFNLKKPVSFITEKDIDLSIGKVSEAIQEIQAKIAGAFSGGIGGGGGSKKTTATTKPEGTGATKKNNKINVAYLKTLKEIPIAAELSAEKITAINNSVRQSIEPFIHAQEKVKEFSAGLREIVETGISDTLVQFGDTLGRVLAGAANRISLLGVILNAFANIMTQIGKLAIATGVAILGIKKALQSLNPYVAIAGGIALIALAAFVRSQAQKISAPKLAEGGLAFGETLATVGDNPNARIDPEVIAPLSKLKNMLHPATQMGQVEVTGEFEIRGDTLLLALDRAEANRGRFRGN